ncbi:MAG: class I SAM-dependent methyltransferase [Acidimicrobiia bacterium]|nr:class I SAM-dependent methyltransferase [Acidimicrobiia bacterium]
MTDEFTTPRTVEEMYGESDMDWDDAVSLADRSLDPRPRTSLYDTFATLGVGEGGYVLDIGGRDASQALDLAERFGCRVLSVDPVQANIDWGIENIAEHEYGHLVEIKLGTINDIPAADDAFDAVFARDMMGHVADLEGALAECRRVLVRGRAMVIHHVFATADLEPKEWNRVCADLALIPERLDAEAFEATVEQCGFKIESIERIGSEWLEHTLEADDGEKRLLRAARLRRDKDRMIDGIGVSSYRGVLGNTVWTIYRMIGKLEDRVYVIRS